MIFSYMGNPGVGSLRIVRNELEAAGWNGRNTPILG